jgi:hypothetical protein
VLKGFGSPPFSVDMNAATLSAFHIFNTQIAGLIGRWGFATEAKLVKATGLGPRLVRLALQVARSGQYVRFDGRHYTLPAAV